MGLATVAVFKNLSGKNSKLKELSDKDLKKLQQTLLSMMKDFDDVCQKNNIDYMLGGGSCLGALRHRGFIPWDDDMDLNMTRKDYEKFCRIFSEELGDNYWLQTPEKTHDYGLAFARLRKKGTVFRSREDYYSDDENGIYIDIFIIENTYNCRIARTLHGLLSLTTGFVLSCRNFYRNRKFYMELAGEDKKVKRVFRTKIMMGFFVSWRSVDGWVKTWNSVNKMCKNNKSRYVVVPTGRRHFFGEIYERKKYCKYERVPFEQMTVLVSKDSDAYMTHLYGDYMKIPEKNQRESHVFIELDFGDKT